MFCHLYTRNGIAYVPTAAKTEAGYFLDIEPVEIVSVGDRSALAQAIKRTIARGHPRIPTPTRATGFPKSIMLKYANIKSLRTFERTALSWHFSKADECFQIEQWQRGPEGGWVPDPAHTMRLPAGTSLDDAINRFTGLIQLGWANDH
jgi:hypothetical protein